MNDWQQAALDLRRFIAQLERWGDLQRIDAPVDPDLEVAAISDRVGKAGGPALRFEQVAGSDLPVLTNLFGTPRRAALALGTKDFASIAVRFADLLASAGPGDGLARLERLLADPQWQPRGGRADLAPVGADLQALPALRNWPGDGGHYFTLPLVVTRDAETGAVNVGLYRVQRLGARTATIRWHAESDAARHHRSWQERDAAMPVTLLLGAPPALLCAAFAPLPTDSDEFALAGLLAGTALEWAEGEGGLPLPSCTEVVLEGTVDPRAMVTEGPFGNHTGYYAPAGPAPIFTLLRQQQRPAALCPATVVGPPPMEDLYLAQLITHLWRPLLRYEIPELVDLAMPPTVIFHGCALLAVADGAGSGEELLRRLWQHRFFRRARLLVLLDADTDVHNFELDFWRCLNQSVPQRDLYQEDGRVGIDARGRDLGPRLERPAALRDQLRRRWREYGLEEWWLEGD